VASENLQAEDSRSLSAGVVYSPKFVPNLTLTLDLFGIETTGWINPFPNPSDVLARVAASNPLPGESATRDANGNLISWTLSAQNTGSQKARGADFGIAYQLQTSFGTFTSTTQATFLDSFQFSSTPGEKERELRSRPIDDFSRDAYLKWKGTSRLDWAWRGFDFTVTANYRDGFHEILAIGPSFPDNKQEHWVHHTWFFDLQASYDLDFLVKTEQQPVPGYSKDTTAVTTGKDAETTSLAQTANSATSIWKWAVRGTKVTIGCNDIFDTDPPRSADNFPRFIYDPTGRFVYVSLTKKF
jgi:TonB dependent receptor